MTLILNSANLGLGVRLRKSNYQRANLNVTSIDNVTKYTAYFENKIRDWADCIKHVFVLKILYICI
jgi:predicted proteasome-type protease